MGANNKSLNKGHAASGVLHGSKNINNQKLECFGFQTPQGMEFVWAENSVQAKLKFLKQSGK